MKKDILAVGLFILLGFLLQSFFSLWSIAILGLIFGWLINRSNGHTFLLGGLAVFLLWGGYAFWLDSANAGILSARIGKLLGNLPPLGLVLLTAFLGGIVGSFSALSGSMARKLFL